MSSDKTWLTQAAYDKLQAELDELIANRPAVAAEINDRREEGDLKENGGYHAAREEQGKQEGRIRQLEELLRNAEIGEAPAAGSGIAVGSVVRLKYVGDDEEEKFLIGSREIAATTDLQVYSPESALGSALMGHHSGDEVSYETPTGAKMSVQVIDVEEFQA
ncbi:transcription elongation factor GreA [Epidermidibacterium keratini]|uniref:Transcription elongation factor GreA n=1 Tax=Epidermidibacterium keratini TaxID=1891644 RepID=A0A7L4YR90_9ACTN|nr:transcription elongation factor GreA [Epidermidibacterium keratini]QHC01299.1 transcription elongation factor GreA [Epidermidibacterium keratini]